jgi:copper(I)-binding protein
MKALVAALLLSCTALGVAAQAPRVDEVWARPTVPGQASGGGYLRIDNKGGAADRLLGARADVSAGVELHRMTMEGDVMRMRKVEAIDVPAGGSVELKPGGLHLMFIGLKAPLTAGSSFPLVLHFERAGEVKVQATVATRTHDHGPGGHKH